MSPQSRIYAKIGRRSEKEKMEKLTEKVEDIQEQVRTRAAGSR